MNHQMEGTTGSPQHQQQQQGMGAQGEPFFDLLQGGSKSGSDFDFKNDNVLPSYDFQPRSSSNGRFHASPPSPANYSNYEQICRPRDPPVSYEAYEPTTTTAATATRSADKEAYDSATVAAVERTMKKYADNLLRVLEGMGSRLSQLESITQRLEQSFEKSRVATGNSLGEMDGEVRTVANMVREVQRGVQILRDKQEITEAQIQLKLQQEAKAAAEASKAEASTAAAAAAAQVPPPPPAASVVSTPQQQLHPSVSASQQQLHPSVSASQQQLHPSVSASQQQLHPPPPPPPFVPTDQSGVTPQTALPQQQQHHHQQIPPPQQQQPFYSQQAPMPTPHGMPPPPPPPQVPHVQLGHQPLGVSQPEAPPYPPQAQAQAQAPPSVNYEMPPPYYPQQRQQQPHLQPQQYVPGPQIYEQGRTASGQLALPAPPYAQQHYEPTPPPPPPPPPASYGGYRMGSSGGYPNLPTAQPVQPGRSSQPTNRPPSRSGVDDVIDQVAAMGFHRDTVRATVQRLTENGQAVDMNVVLDKLMNGGGGGANEQPKSGWFGPR